MSNNAPAASEKKVESKVADTKKKEEKPAASKKSEEKQDEKSKESRRYFIILSRNNWCFVSKIVLTYCEISFCKFSAFSFKFLKLFLDHCNNCFKH